MDYGKFRFDQQQEAGEAKKKQKQVQIKEIKFRPGTDDGDYQVKLRNQRFPERRGQGQGHCEVSRPGSSHRELGIELLKQIEPDLDEHRDVEQQPKMEGRQMVMVLGPKKK